MTSAELAARIVESFLLDGEEKKITAANVRGLMDAVFYEILRQLKDGGDVTVTNFGRFYVSRHRARNGKNPRTSATILIPAKNRVTFSPAKSARDAVN